MKRLLQITLGVLTSIGGFLDVEAIAPSGPLLSVRACPSFRSTHRPAHASRPCTCAGGYVASTAVNGSKTL